MKQRCDAKLWRKPGRCRKWAVTGKRRCRLHGGAAGHGRHLSEDASHSVSFSKARAARGPLYPLDHSAGGRERARWAIRANGRFLPGKASVENMLVDKGTRALDKVERIIEETIMAKTKRLASATEASRAAWKKRTQEDPNPVAVPATFGLSDPFTEAGAVALAKARDFLGTPIDFRQLANPAWLNDGENRKNAAILLRFAQEQMNVAMQLIRDQIDAARALPSRNALAHEQKMLEQLIDDFDIEAGKAPRRER